MPRPLRVRVSHILRQAGDSLGVCDLTPALLCDWANDKEPPVFTAPLSLRLPERSLDSLIVPISTTLGAYDDLAAFKAAPAGLVAVMVGSTTRCCDGVITAAGLSPVSNGVASSMPSAGMFSTMRTTEGRSTMR